MGRRQAAREDGAAKRASFDASSVRGSAPTACTAGAEKANSGQRAPVREAAFGRYQIDDEIGAGGMGVVYRAYDPILERPVALKIVKSLTRGIEAQRRLFREAQLLAQLRHPNIVTVYDVGTLGDDVFVAMALVDGTPLSIWQRDRDWREVLQAYVEAGRGLAAAHECGLVHRDIKPSNILVDGKGHVTVIDFGLATVADAERLPTRDRTSTISGHHPPPTSGEHGPSTSVDEKLTRAGDLVGTPRYMAPEQHKTDEHVDDRSDQYSFAVAVYESVCGVWPFRRDRSDDEVTGFYTAKRQQRLVPPVQSVPSHLRRTLERALAYDPDERFRSMRELLSALEKDPARVRRRWLAFGSTLVAVATVSVLWARTQSVEATMCKTAAGELATVWDDTVREKAHDSFVASNVPYANDIYGRVASALDAYAEKWVTMRTQACEATSIYGIQSEQLLDLRMRCLDRRRAELGALVTLFTGLVDASMVDRALSATQSLLPLDRCTNDSDFLQRSSGLMEPVTSPQLQTQVDDVASRIARVDALEKTGQLRAGEIVATEALARANRIAYRPMQAEAEHHLASILERLGRLKEAEAHASRALFLADASGHEAYRAKTAGLYSVLLGYHARHFEQARLLERQARAAIERLGNDQALLSAWHNQVSLNRLSEEQFDEAFEHIKEAQQINQRLYGPVSSRSAYDHLNVGVIHYQRGEYDQAIDAFQQAYDMWTILVGPDNVKLATPLFNLGLAHHRKKNLGAAAQYFRKAMKIRVRSHGEQHRSVVTLWGELGDIHLELNQARAAQKDFDNALRIAVSIGDKETEAQYRLELGKSYLMQSQVPLADEEFTRALSICRDVKCTARESGELFFEVAELLSTRGQVEPAVRCASEALAIYRRLPAESEGTQQVEAWLKGRTQ